MFGFNSVNSISSSPQPSEGQQDFVFCFLLFQHTYPLFCKYLTFQAIQDFLNQQFTSLQTRPIDYLNSQLNLKKKKKNQGVKTGRNVMPYPYQIFSEEQTYFHHACFPATFIDKCSTSVSTGKRPMSFNPSAVKQVLMVGNLSHLFSQFTHYTMTQDQVPRSIEKPDQIQQHFKY